MSNELITTAITLLTCLATTLSFNTTVQWILK
jgi:hypothetical protein